MAGPAGGVGGAVCGCGVEEGLEGVGSGGKRTGGG